MGPLIPLFWTSSDVSSGFQSQSGQPYSHLTEAYYVCPRRLTSGAIPADLLMASMAVSCFLHMCVSVEIGCRIQ